MRPIKKASTDQSVVIRIIDSTDGTPENAVEHDTSGIDLWYRREGATKTSITEAALAALDSAHSDGGIELIGDGYYRLDLPDAAVASGANGVMVGGTVTGMIVIGCYIPLVDYDPYDSVRAGLTALPNAAADAAGGLPISDAGGLDIDTLLGRITGNVALASVCTEIRLAELAAANLPADVDALIARLTAARAGYLDELAAANLPADIDALTAAIAALNDLSAAEVNAEVVDALATDTYAEPGQGAPAATASLAAKINYLYKMWRNKKMQDATTFELYNDAGAVVDQKATVSDDGTDYTHGEIVSGP